MLIPMDFIFSVPLTKVWLGQLVIPV